MTYTEAKYVDIHVTPERPEQLVPYVVSDASMANNISITKIEGALTNVIYKASLLDESQNPTGQNYLLRLYDTKNDSIVDRESELDVLRRLPPSFDMIKILFHFENGRVENFLDEYRAIKSSEMKLPHNMHKIAQRFKELHTQVTLTESEKKLYYGNPSEFRCFVWDKIFVWLDTIEQYESWLNGTQNKNVQRNLLCRDWQTFKHIVHKYKNWLTENETSGFQNMAMCHNDTQHGNIMLERTADANSDVIFIDFEYGGIDPVEFDLANFATECMNDYEAGESWVCDPQRYPSKDALLYFVQSYYDHLDGAVEINCKTVKQMAESITRWRACSQLFWSVWAVLQSGELTKGANDTPVDQTGRFEYLKFCRSKMSLFWGDMISFGIATPHDCIISEVTTMDVDIA